jgi:DNA invertase Pin-like site-specific DNA recombinase
VSFFINKSIAIRGENMQDYSDIIEYCRKSARKEISEILETNKPLLNSSEGRILVEEQIYSVVIRLISYVQTTTAINRKELQRKGIETAKNKGIAFGRKKQFDALDYIDIYKKEAMGEKSMNEVMEETGASRTTYFKMKKELKEQGII